ncbi:aspartate/glutamate racemase family protein [Aminobacter sp. AP02]|uniref:maleate cis-trans isomerase family protein n=1 Tax=Aminobacter sp. AP02 TaxID=2135737 RepID=UPI000D6D64A9|nr:aspartate/glutamate racemase family protein [Aminobacter sp. AP02]PWK76797.1 maleate isomerase [Aminobacter sp. AP02]
MTIAAHQAGKAGLVSNIENIPFDTDNGIGQSANLGLLVLRTDQTIEDEFRFALPEGVALYEARLHSPVEITPDNLRKMEADIPGTVGLLPDVRFDVIGFGCTSGSLVIGEAQIARRVREVMPGVEVTDPVTAALAAFKAMGAKKIALLTPYIATINHALREAFMARGLEIPVMGSFNEPDDNLVARITTEAIEKAILDVGASEECEAVFVSCTSLRVARIAERVEVKLGKPVTSSNHAMAWHMLRLGGYDKPIEGLGTLYRTKLAG